MIRKFKAGDWVKIRGVFNAPKMKVLKYTPMKDTVSGLVNNDTYLECVWYENGERKMEVFHQNKLIKYIEAKEVVNTV